MLLFDWVDQDHGGMIVVAGPVNAGRAAEGWVQDPEMAKIRKLYPVEFNQGLSTRSNVTYGSEEPWPLEFTREGLQAAYLWLGDSAIASQATWSQFTGRLQLLPRPRQEGGRHRAGPLRRFPHGPGRPAADLHGGAPLQCLAGLVSGQCRDLAAAAGRSGVVRPVLDQDHPLRGPGAPPPPVVAAVRCRSIATATTWALRWKCGRN